MKTEQIKIIKKYDSEKDKLCVEIEISEEIQKRLKDCCVEGTKEHSLCYDLNDSYVVIRRYLVKNPITRSINIDDCNGILFSKELLDNRKITLFVINVQCYDGIVNAFKRYMRDVIQTCNMSLNTKETIINVSIEEL